MSSSGPIAQVTASAATASAATDPVLSIIAANGTVDVSQFTSIAVPYPKELTEAEMIQMSTEDLQKYADEVSTSIGLEYSTIYGYETIQGRVENSIRSTENEIKKIDDTINSNDVLLIAANLTRANTNNQIRFLDSTINSYTSRISLLDANITSTTKTISSLFLEANTIDSTIAIANDTFISSARGYSTLLDTYNLKLSEYNTLNNQYKNESYTLSTLNILERSTFNVYQALSTAVVQYDIQYKSTVTASNAIQDALPKLNELELNATTSYNSTLVSFITLSSLYTTSLITQEYYRLISNQTIVINQYNDAMSTFIRAENSYKVSPGNTMIVDSYKTASTVLNTRKLAKDTFDNRVSSQQSLLTGAQSFSYDAIIGGYNSTIQYETSLISTFSNYESTAKADIIAYGRLYSTSLTQLNTSIISYNTNSTMYNTNMNLISTTTSQLLPETSTILSLGRQTSSLSTIIVTYSTNVIMYDSSFNGYKALSTAMLKDYNSSLSNVTRFSTQYGNTLNQINDFTIQLSRANSSIIGYTAILNVNSSIVERETVNIQQYNNAIVDSVASQEFATAQYFETYIRTKRLEKDNIYNATILDEIRTVSTINGKALIAANGAPVTLLPINLTTATIKNAFDELTNITRFLDSFGTIYSRYIEQSSNYSNIAQSVTNKQMSLLTLQSTQNQLITANATPEIESLYTTAVSDWIAKDTQYNTFVNTASTVQVEINQLRNSFRTSLISWLPGNEFTVAASTISSFIIQGNNLAV